MLVAGGIAVATTITTTTTFGGSEGVSRSSEAESAGPGIAMIVCGALLLLAGFVLGKTDVRLPSNLDGARRLSARVGAQVTAMTTQQQPAGDVVGVLAAPVPPQELHNAALRGVESEQHPSLTVLEDRPGLIRIGRCVAGTPPQFAVHVEVSPTLAGSQARIIVAYTEPSTIPGQGVVGGDELDALLGRLRGSLASVATGTAWV